MLSDSTRANLLAILASLSQPNYGRQTPQVGNAHTGAPASRAVVAERLGIAPEHVERMLQAEAAQRPEAEAAEVHAFLQRLTN